MGLRLTQLAGFQRGIVYPLNVRLEESGLATGAREAVSERSGTGRKCCILIYAVKSLGKAWSRCGRIEKFEGICSGGKRMTGSLSCTVAQLCKKRFDTVNARSGSRAWPVFAKFGVNELHIAVGIV